MTILSPNLRFQEKEKNYLFMYWPSLVVKINSHSAVSPGIKYRKIKVGTVSNRPKNVALASSLGASLTHFYQGHMRNNYIGNFEPQKEQFFSCGTSYK